MFTLNNLFNAGALLKDTWIQSLIYVGLLKVMIQSDQAKFIFIKMAIFIT